MADPSSRKSRYYRVDVEKLALDPEDLELDLDQDLPEPDYFELEKIYYEPPTTPSAILCLLKNAMRWTIRNLFLLFLLTLFIIASFLYISTSIPERPSFNQILRAGVVTPKQIEVGITETQTGTTTSNGDTTTVEVNGSDVSNADGDDIIIDGGTPVNVTSGDGGVAIQIAPSNGTLTSGSSGSNRTTSGSNNPSSSSSSSSSSTGSSQSDTGANSSKNTTTSKPPPPSSGGKDGGQVSIQDPTAQEQEPFTPIKATFYSGVDGPTHCRGHVIGVVNMPKPQASGVPSIPQCYNFAGSAYSGCGTFLANKADGCIANFFSEPNCVSYVNTAAFMPENRAVGGHWRSAQVQCGVPEPDPESLGKPPMMDQISSLVDNDKNKPPG